MKKSYFQAAIKTDLPIQELARIFGPIDTTAEEYTTMDNNPGRGCKFCGNPDVETRMKMCFSCFQNNSRKAGVRNNLYITRSMYPSIHHLRTLIGTAQSRAERFGFKQFEASIIPAGTQPHVDKMKYQSPLQLSVDYGNPVEPRLWEMRSPNQKFYAMKTLEHPETLIIQGNEFYPNGLTEQDIHNYYQTMASRTNEYVIPNTDRFITIKADDKLVVKRNLDNKSALFGALNTGRTVEFHFAAQQHTPYIWLDLDPKEGFPFDDVKKTATELLGLMSTDSDCANGRIYYSGKDGMYVICNLHSPMDIDAARSRMQDTVDNYLKKTKDDRLTSEATSEQGKMRIDCSTLRRTGGLRMPYSLAYPTGLVCLPIESANIQGFQKEDAKIDNVISCLNQPR